MSQIGLTMNAGKNIPRRNIHISEQIERLFTFRMKSPNPCLPAIGNHGTSLKVAGHNIVALQTVLPEMIPGILVQSAALAG